MDRRPGCGALPFYVIFSFPGSHSDQHHAPTIRHLKQVLDTMACHGTALLHPTCRCAGPDVTRPGNQVAAEVPCAAAREEHSPYADLGAHAAFLAVPSADALAAPSAAAVDTHHGEQAPAAAHCSSAHIVQASVRLDALAVARSEGQPSNE